MKQVIKLWVFVLLAVVLFSSCEKTNGVQTHIPNISPGTPVAYAGPDQCTLDPMDSTELRGSGTDQDGFIVSYRWRLVAGPASLTIVNPNNAATRIKNLVIGNYMFELKVTGNNGLTAVDYVDINIRTPWDYCRVWHKLFSYPDRAEWIGA